MTRYVVQSGGIKKYPEKAREYFAEMFEGRGQNPTFLWCFFASTDEDYNGRSEKYIDLFSQHFPENVEPEYLTATVEDFAEQVAAADIIYLHGGYVDNLYKRLGLFDLPELFDGKVVGTNSASSMYLANSSWSCDSLSLKDGIGILPFKIIVHYKSNDLPEKGFVDIDWEAKKAELAAYRDNELPVYALEEGEFFVIKI